MNEITLRYQFTGAGTSPAYRVTGPGLLMQTSGPTATLQGSNMPEVEASWQTLGQGTGYTPLQVNTPFAYVRAIVAAACLVVVSSAATAMPTGGGGGGGGETIPTNAITLAGEPITLAGDYITLGA